MPTRLVAFVRELFVFGIKEARACIFAGSFFVLLFLSNHMPLFGVARYDFLFIAAVGIQVVLYLTKVETWDEVKVIFLFHIIGMGLEIFKTHPAIGSWAYPEAGLLKIATVPLYSGFMYAAVGSYISQAWRILKVEIEGHPHFGVSVGLAAAIYLNFFTHHFLPDVRWVLIAFVFVFFLRTKIHFTVLEGIQRTIPLNLAFLLIAFFIWIAENISTYLGAWQYPSQVHAWHVVSANKITSWFLLVIISFLIIAYLKHYKRDVLRRE